MSPRSGSAVIGGRRAVTEAIRSGVATEVLIAYAARETQGMRAVLQAAANANVPVRRVEKRDLDHLARDNQGIVARIRSGAGPRELGERGLDAFPFQDDALVVVLDGITDPQNLGAAARSAEAAGAALLISRTRRAAPTTPAAVRASAGALLHLPHARVANIARALDRLKDAGFTIVGLDGGAPDTIYDAPCPKGNVALVLGGEDEGMARLTRERCDLLVSLPMLGRVGSLNASASLAAALFAYVLPARAV